jgi:glycosyltransferase involved in cell wall biosynthesis
MDYAQADVPSANSDLGQRDGLSASNNGTALPTLSVAMIVKDEAERIEAAITSAREIADEIVVLDTGSTDATREIASSLGARVEHFEWFDDFAAARNASFRHCTGEWIMWMDADDVIPPAAVEGFLSLREHLIDAQGVNSVHLPLAFFHPDGQIAFEISRIRIVRATARPLWSQPIHEELTCSPGDAITSWPSAWVEDHNHLSKPPNTRNLMLLERRVAKGFRTSHHLFYLAHENASHQRWNQATAFFEEFLDHPIERVDIRYHAMMMLSDVYRDSLRPELVEKTLLRAVRLDPTQAEAFIRLGEIQVEAHQWHLALPYLLAATGATTPPSMEFNNRRFQPWWAWDRIAIVSEHLGDIIGAINATYEAIDLSPSTEHDRLRSNLAYFESKR